MAAGKALGEEQWFSELLSGDGGPPILDRLERFNIKRALDIGCGDATALVLMYYLFGSEHLEGVDSRTVSEVLQATNEMVRKKRPSHQDWHTIEELWNNCVTTDGTDRMPQVHDVGQYSKFMKVTFGESIIDYSPKLPAGEKYDAIIVSQVLHTLHPAIILRIGEIIKRYSRPQSLIYYSVKDNFMPGQGFLDGQTILSECHKLARELEGFDVVHIEGPISEKEGRCHIFTNL